MNWLGHIVVGELFGFLASVAIGKPFGIELATLALLCSLAPDVDHPLSKGFGLLVAAICGLSVSFAVYSTKDLSTGLLRGIALALALLAVVLLIKPRHRGFTHSLTACLIAGTGLFLLFNSLPIAIVGMGGYFSHLAADRVIKIW